jgi:hypothetical protein
VEKAREYCAHGAEKSADFLAANEWIEREWPKIIAEYSPEDTMQTKQDSA